MKIQQLRYLDKAWKIYLHSDGFDRMQCQLVLAFGAPGLITDTSVFNHLERSYPEAQIILYSTPGEAIYSNLFNNSVSVTAIEFQNTSVICAETNINDHYSSYEAGKQLMKELQQKDLTSAFIISDGTCINCSGLADGFNASNEGRIPVTGRLAGDGARFFKTLEGLNKFPGEGTVVAVGFYGQQRNAVDEGQFQEAVAWLFRTTLIH